MEKKPQTYTNIDEYIALQPAEIQLILQELRKTIQAAAPQATEKISYQLPTFYLMGNLVHFAVFKDHYSFFPASSGIAAFQEELLPYSGSKGTVRFPLDEPLPLDLISRIVKFRVAENLKRVEEKKAARKKTPPKTS